MISSSALIFRIAQVKRLSEHVVSVVNRVAETGSQACLSFFVTFFRLFPVLMAVIQL
jgi:hypothetical protein